MTGGSCYLDAERANYVEKATLEGCKISKAQSPPELTSQGGSEKIKPLCLSLPFPLPELLRGFPQAQTSREPAGRAGEPGQCTPSGPAPGARSWAELGCRGHWVGGN